MWFTARSSTYLILNEVLQLTISVQLFFNIFRGVWDQHKQKASSYSGCIFPCPWLKYHDTGNEKDYLLQFGQSHMVNKDISVFNQALLQKSMWTWIFQKHLLRPHSNI